MLLLPFLHPALFLLTVLALIMLAAMWRGTAGDLP